MTLKQILHRLNRRDTRLLPKNLTLSKIILIFLAVFAVTFTAKTILAETTTTTGLIKAKQDAIKKGNNQESWLNDALSSNMVSTLGALTGGIPFEEDGSIKLTGYYPGGTIGTANKMIASLYDQPVSGVEYLAQVKDNFLGKTAYAQDTAFKSLSPILPLWRTIRNFIYVIISIIFVIIGIMIMLRVKVSPQAVVTIQNSIPKIITSLILVTFSYAIAGLIIDLSKFVLSFCLAIFFTAKGTSFTEDLFGVSIGNTGVPIISWLGDLIKWVYTSAAGLFGYHPFSLNSLANSDFGKIYDLTQRSIPASSGVALGEIAGQIFTGTLLSGVGSLALGGFGKDVGGIVGGVGGDVLGGLGGLLLLPLIMAILIVFWLIKLYFGLLKCYVTLIFKIIISPIQIGFGALPSSKSGFSHWLIEVIANVSVFPATTLLLVFINYLCDILTYSGDMWIPSQISLTTISGNSTVIAAGIGLAGLGLLSKIPKVLPEIVFKLKDAGFGSAIGDSYKSLSGFGGKATSGLLGFGVNEGARAADNRWGHEVSKDQKDEKGNPLKVPATKGWGRAVHAGSRMIDYAFGKKK